MNNFVLSRALTALVFAALSELACAAAQRTFVASNGNDANPCSLNAPCRTFAAAIAQTNPSGEIIVLDSAGYGPVTITKSVSIIAPPGIYAGISVFSPQDGITINAAPTDRIVLRGLNINGQGGSAGIRALAAREVHVESCTIAYMASSGIVGTNAYLRVAGSTIRSNSGSGIDFATGSLIVEDSDVARNATHGVFVHDAVGAAVRGSRLDNNASSGAELTYSGAIASADIAFSRSDSSSNGAAGIGMTVSATSGSVLVRVTIDDVNVEHNASQGVFIFGDPGAETVRGSINWANIAYNGQFGVFLNAGAAGLMTISQSAINHNVEAGVVLEGTAAGIIDLNANTIARNGSHDIEVFAPAVVRTSGNNTLTGDATDILGTLTPNPQK